MKKVLSVFLAVLMVMGCLSACAGNPFQKVDTKEKLMEGYKTEVESAKSMSFIENVEAKAHASFLGQEQSFTMRMQMDVESAGDVTHIKADSEMVNGDESSREKSEQYIQMGEKDAVVYFKDEGTPGWYKRIESGAGEAVSSVKSLKDIQIEGGDGKTPLGDPVEFNGKECYVVESKVDDDMLSSVMGTAGELFEGVDLDTSGMEFAVKMYFDKQSKKIEGMEVNLAEGLSKLLQNAMTSQLGFSIDMAFDEFRLVISGIEFNKVDKIEIPEDALAGTEIVDDVFDPGFVDEDAKQETENTEGIEEQDSWSFKDEWFNIELKNGTVIDIRGTHLQDLVDAGFILDEMFEKYVVNAGDSETIFGGENGGVSVYVENEDKETAKSVQECRLVNYEIDFHDSGDLNGKVSTLGYGDTYETAIERFGNPTHVNMYEDTGSLTWEDEDYNSIEVMFDRQSGAIISVELWYNK